MATIAKLNLKFTKTQKRAWETLQKHNCNELVLCQSRQSGKSVFLEFCCIYYLLNSPRANIGFIGPQFAHCRKVFQDIIRILEPTELIKSANASTLQIEMVNGARISFFSAESPNAIRGQTFCGLCAIDECSFIPETTSDGQDFFNSIVMPTCKAKKPKIIYASTPRNKGSFFHQKYLKGLEPHTQGVNKTHTIKATIYDDSLLTEEEIQEIKDSIPELSFKMEFMCEFADNAMSAFTDYVDKFTINKQIDFNVPLWAAVDFHSVGSDDTIVTLMDKDNNAWQYNIKGSLDSQYKQIAYILDRCNKLVIAYCESNSIGSVMTNEIKKLTKQKSKIIEWTTTNETKENQVGLIQTLLTKDMMHFESRNTQLKSQFDTFTYSFSKTKKVTYAALAGYHDDRVLSLMMCVQAKEDYKWSTGNNVVFVKSRSASSMR